MPTVLRRLGSYAGPRMRVYETAPSSGSGVSGIQCAGGVADTGGPGHTPTHGSDGTEMKSILDPTFKYYPSGDTDLRRTFHRIREEMRQKSIERSERGQASPSGQIPASAAPHRLRMTDLLSA